MQPPSPGSQWGLHGVPLEARIAFLESHWAFFLGGRVVERTQGTAADVSGAWHCLCSTLASRAPPPCPGFGASTVLPMATLPFYTSAAAVGVAFPLFITTACAADPRHAYELLAPGPAAKGGAAVSGSGVQAAAQRRRLRIFGPACWLTTAAFSGIGRLSSAGLRLRVRTAGTSSSRQASRCL